MAAMTEPQSPEHLRHIGRGGSQNLVASVLAALLGILLSIVVAFFIGILVRRWLW